MQDRVAERLLAKVLGWDSDDVVRETARLQAIARYKYDGYQQFQPGRRFVESLALWLQQFETQDERRVAFRFVMERLVFVSQAEMSQLVRSAYQDVIRQEIISHAAQDLKVPAYNVAHICNSQNFRVIRRQTLFLGLSDGSRMDQLRRASRDLSHEQVYQSHELSAARAAKMQRELVADLRGLLNRETMFSESRFRVVCLLDDFTGSGLTYLRKDEHGVFKGKLASFYEEACSQGSPLSLLLDIEHVSVYVVFYMAFERGIEHIKGCIPDLWRRGPVPQVRVVAPVPCSVSIAETTDSAFFNLCKKDSYYDAEALQDRHTNVGGNDARLGFANCALPLVFSHNTPNNSVAALWAYDNARFRGLFPRVPRYAEVE